MPSFEELEALVTDDAADDAAVVVDPDVDADAELADGALHDAGGAEKDPPHSGHLASGPRARERTGQLVPVEEGASWHLVGPDGTRWKLEPTQPCEVRVGFGWMPAELRLYPTGWWVEFDFRALSYAPIAHANVLRRLSWAHGATRLREDGPGVTMQVPAARLEDRVVRLVDAPPADPSTL